MMAPVSMLVMGRLPLALPSLAQPERTMLIAGMNAKYRFMLPPFGSKTAKFPELTDQRPRAQWQMSRVAQARGRDGARLPAHRFRCDETLAIPCAARRTSSATGVGGAMVGRAQTPLRPRRIKKRKERYNGHAKSVSPITFAGMRRRGAAYIVPNSHTSAVRETERTGSRTHECLGRPSPHD